MRIVFAGTPVFAERALHALIDHGHHIVAVYSQPDRPSGRGMRFTPSPVKQLALQHDIPVCQPTGLKDQAGIQTLAGWKADLMIVAAYGLLLPEAILTAPKLGCVNIHASLLPRWRGAAPIARAIEAGDKQTGITMMQMDKGLDTGDILLVRQCPIADDDTAASLHDRLAELGAQTCLAFLDDYQAVMAHRRPQQGALSSYATKLSKEEGRLDWTQTAQTLAFKIRAFNPWPVTFTQWDEERWRIHAAQPLPTAHDAPPGMILAATKQGIDVATGEGILRLKTLQRPGRKAQDAAVFIHAGHIQTGQQLY